VAAAPSDAFRLPAISGETGYVGQLFVDGYSASILQAGDKGMFQQDTYRGIVSFDASSLPSGFTPSNAVLRLTPQSMTGAVSGLTIDIKCGTFTFSAEVNLAEYWAIASASSVGNVAVSATQHIDIPLTSSSLRYINVPGTGCNRTQLRIRASTTPGLSPNTIVFANADQGSSAPVLIVS
jgi:hypothetical protein